MKSKWISLLTALLLVLAPVAAVPAPPYYVDADGTIHAKTIITTTPISASLTGSWFSKSLTLYSYSTGDNALLVKADNNWTVNLFTCVTGGTDNVTVELQECDSAGANCASGGILVAATSTPASDNTFTDASIDSGDWIKVLFSSIVGTATYVSCTLRYALAP